MRYADGPVAEATVLIEASPERVWELVSDIHLVASLSSEVQEVGWLGGADAAAPGATFRGRSAHPAVGEWSTTSTVVVCEPHREFGWDVEDTTSPTASWRFELTPHEGGTRLRQWARMGPGPSNLTTVIASMPDREERIVAVRLQEWQDGIEGNLASLKELAEKPA